jgi:ferredoxin
MLRAILYDSTLCIGCKACEGACAERWGLPYNDKIAAERAGTAARNHLAGAGTGALSIMAACFAIFRFIAQYFPIFEAQAQERKPLQMEETEEDPAGVR